ncbi:MAG: diflavin oxidoreductase [Lysobacterales bacterium]
MLNALTTENSPFSETQIDRLRHGLGDLDAGQSAWLSGYLAGRLASQVATQETNWPDPSAALSAATRSDAAHTAPALEVLYASETGNGQGVADRLARRAAAAGLAVKSRSLDGYRPADLARLRRAAFVMSTHGDGDPPEEAAELFEYLESPRAADLPNLEFCILALGDRSYEKFCEAGRRLEALLLARGARTFAPRVECDVDFEAAAQAWSEVLLEHDDVVASRSAVPGNAASGRAASARLSVVAANAAIDLPADSPTHSPWSRQRPFRAEVQRLQKITGLESTKEVYHLELSLAGSGIRYEPGDALGVWPLNSAESVKVVLGALGLEATQQVEVDGERRSLQEWLVRHRELTRLAPDSVRAYAAHGRAALGQHGALARHLETLGEPGLRSFIEQRQWIDLFEEYPVPLTALQLLGLLRPLSPRSYSIASSQAAVGDEVQLTVASLYSNALGRRRTGVASDQLNRRLQPGDHVSVFLEAKRRFRLPADPAAPLIMIGAGTGVAPYRAFMQQLEAEGRAAKSWLIFGNPHLRTDFLYQREWLRWRAEGLLTRIDAAFSRDQAQKRYVQDIVSERAAELADWLERGAHLYICGGLAMGHAVEGAVERALERYVAPRRMSGTQAAADWLAELRQQHRLAKDLY